MNNTGVQILSILIPTIPPREFMFMTLLEEVTKQAFNCMDDHPMLGRVGIYWNDEKAFLDGGLSIGKKRDDLLRRAEGKYLCFLDDDENIAPNYVETILRLCQQDMDVVTFRSIAKLDTYWSIIDMRLSHPENEQASPDYIVHRRPWHINAIRSEIAKRYTFPDTNYSEDSDWMNNVILDLKTEAHTDAVLHQYNHSKKHSEADKIITHGLLAK